MFARDSLPLLPKKQNILNSKGKDEAPAAGLPKKSTQDDRQGKKRPKDGRVANELLPFSVYVEKFDSANSKIKLSASKWIDIRAGIFKTFMDSPWMKIFQFLFLILIQYKQAFK